MTASAGDDDATGPRLLKGHTDKVTCLAAPDVPNKNYLLSGSADFTVRAWNLEYAQSGERAEQQRTH
jgi:WD40 repeat protein